MSDKPTSERSSDMQNKIQNGQAQPIYLINPSCDDQINLMDLVDTLIHRWKTIVIIALMVTAGSVIYSINRQQSYVSEAILVQSDVSDSETRPDKSVGILFSSKATLADVASKLSTGSGEEISVNKLHDDLKITTDGKFLQLSYSDSSPAFAQLVLDLVVKNGMERVESLAREAFLRESENILLKQKLISERVEQLRQQIKAYLPDDNSDDNESKVRGKQPLIRLGDSWSTVSLKVLNLHREYLNLLGQLKDLEISHESIKGKLADIKLWLPLKIMDSPTLPEKQKQSLLRKTVILAGLFFGLILGAIIALFFDAYSKHKRKRME